MEARTAGMVIVVLGVLAVAAGLAVMTGALSWIGRLPGDLRYSNGNTRLYVPLTTMIVLSVALSLASLIIRRWF